MATLPPMTLHSSVQTAMGPWSPRYEPQLYWRKIRLVTLSLSGTQTETGPQNGEGTLFKIVSTTDGPLTMSADNGGAHKGYSTGRFGMTQYALDGPLGKRPSNPAAAYFSAGGPSNGTYTEVHSFTGPNAPEGYSHTRFVTDLHFSLSRQANGLWMAASSFGSDQGAEPIAWDDFDRGGSWAFPYSQSITTGAYKFTASGSFTINLIT